MNQNLKMIVAVPIHAYEEMEDSGFRKMFAERRDNCSFEFVRIGETEKFAIFWWNNETIDADLYRKMMEFLEKRAHSFIEYDNGKGTIFESVDPSDSTGEYPMLNTILNVQVRFEYYNGSYHEEAADGY